MFSNDDRLIIQDINKHINSGQRDFCITYQRYIGNADIYQVCEYYKRNGLKIGYIKKEMNNDFEHNCDSKEHSVTFWIRPIDK